MDIKIDKKDKKPVYMQIYEQFQRLILTEQLAEGTVLPPERKLAASLGVNRSTVLNAYNKLKQEELIDSRVGQGTVVTMTVRERERAERPKWHQLFDSRIEDLNHNVVSRLFPMMGKKDIISFALGMADPGMIPDLPFHALAEYTRTAGNGNVLSQTPVAGDDELRQNICKLLANENLLCTPDQVMILVGSQQGIDIAARLLLQPGDVVAVEAPTYFLALQTFKSVGAHIIEVPIDKNGMRMEALEHILKKYHPKCIYTIPNCQNPSSSYMSLERRKKLVELSHRYEAVVIEDDAYAGLGFGDRTIPSLYALDGDGYVIYLRSFSKTVCSGLRLGYMVADNKMIALSCMLRQNMDIHPNNISQWLVNAFIKSGDYEAHVKRIREEYKQKCNLMHDTLLRHAPCGLLWTKPLGGYYFWCRLPEGVMASELLEACIKEGVAFMPGVPFFTYENGESYIRLNFTTPSEEQIRTGIPVICSNIVRLADRVSREKRWSPGDCYPIY